MGDRTYAALVVHRLDVEKYPAEAEAIMGAIEDYGLSVEFGVPSVPSSMATVTDDSLLKVGVTYSDDQASCGIVYDLQDLGEKAPHAVFSIQEDPKYEWLGAVLLFTPELGPWMCSSDADGSPVATTEAVAEMLDTTFAARGDGGVPSYGEVRDVLRRSLGIPWMEAIGEVIASEGMPK